MFTDILNRIRALTNEQGITAYLVGGSVRDQLLGRTAIRDLDLAVAGDASGLARHFADATGGAFYLMDAEHNVARVLWGNLYVDFAKLRGSIDQDLATRDFTVNAMARSLDEQSIVDPFGGQQDLRQKLIRALGRGVFQNDPVRLLRAVRMEGELGFRIERETEQWIRQDAQSLARASAERARDELFRILALPDAADRLRRLDNLSLLSELIPEITDTKGIPQSPPHVYDVFEHSVRALEALVAIQQGGYAEIAAGHYSRELEEHFSSQVSADRSRAVLLRFTTLLHDIGKAVTRTQDEQGAIHFYRHEDRGAELAEPRMRRLRLSRDETEIVKRTIQEHLRPPQLAKTGGASDRAIYRFFRDAGKEGIDVCVLSLADTRAKGPMPSGEESEDTRAEDLQPTLARLLDRYYHATDTVIRPAPLVDGKTLMRELGIRPGPLVGELLEMIREGQAAGQIKTREEAVELARYKSKRTLAHPPD